MNRQAQIAVITQLRHLDLSDQTQTFREAEIGPSESVPTIFLTYKPHICEKLKDL